MNIKLELTVEEQRQIFDMIKTKINNSSGRIPQMNLAKKIIKLNPDLLDEYERLIRFESQ